MNCPFCKNSDQSTWCHEKIGLRGREQWVCSRERGHSGIHVGCSVVYGEFVNHIRMFTNEVLIFDLNLHKNEMLFL
jgi:hypothetical protein